MIRLLWMYNVANGARHCSYASAEGKGHVMETVILPVGTEAVKELEKESKNNHNHHNH